VRGVAILKKCQIQIPVADFSKALGGIAGADHWMRLAARATELLHLKS